MGQADGDPDYQYPPKPVAGPPGTWTLISSGTTVLAADSNVTILAITRGTAAVPWTIMYVDTSLASETVANTWGPAALIITGLNPPLEGAAWYAYRRPAAIPDEQYEVVLRNQWNDGTVKIGITIDWRHYEVT